MARPKYAYPSDFASGPMEKGKINPNTGWAQVFDWGNLNARAEAKTKMFQDYAGARTKRNLANQKKLKQKIDALEGEALGVRDREMRNMLMQQKETLAQTLKGLAAQGYDISSTYISGDDQATQKLQEARTIAKHVNDAAANEKMLKDAAEDAQKRAKEEDGYELNNILMSGAMHAMEAEEMANMYEEAYPGFGEQMMKLDMLNRKYGFDSPLGNVDPTTADNFLIPTGKDLNEISQELKTDKLYNKGTLKKQNGSWIVENQAEQVPAQSARSFITNRVQGEFISDGKLNKGGRQLLARALKSDEQTYSTFVQIMNGERSTKLQKAVAERYNQMLQEGMDEAKAINMVMYELGTGRDAMRQGDVQDGQFAESPLVKKAGIPDTGNPAYLSDTGQPMRYYGAHQAVEAGNPNAMGNVAGLRFADEELSRFGETTKRSKEIDTAELRRAQGQADKQVGILQMTIPQKKHYHVMGEGEATTVDTEGILFADDQEFQFESPRSGQLSLSSVVLNRRSGKRVDPEAVGSEREATYTGFVKVGINEDGEIAKPGDKVVGQAFARRGNVDADLVTTQQREDAAQRAFQGAPVEAIERFVVETSKRKSGKNEPTINEGTLGQEAISFLQDMLGSYGTGKELVEKEKEALENLSGDTPMQLVARAYEIMQEGIKEDATRIEVEGSGSGAMAVIRDSVLTESLQPESDGDMPLQGALLEADTYDVTIVGSDDGPEIRVAAPTESYEVFEVLQNPTSATNVSAALGEPRGNVRDVVNLMQKEVAGLEEIPGYSGVYELQDESSSAW